MKNLNPDLVAHLAGGATTLARCWIVTRSDGLRLGFTDHDRPLWVDGTSCHPENGVTATSDVSGPGLATGGGEIGGALSSQSLTDDDLEAGLWDGAAVEVFLVNWREPAQRVLLRRAKIGEVSRKGEAFQAEVRGLAHLLEVRRGRVFSRSCDADLGDARCGVDLDDPSYRANATVVFATGEGEVMLAGLGSFQAGWFTGGRFEVLSGERSGFRSEISGHRIDGSEVVLTLWQSPPSPLEAGISVRVLVGCDKRFATCRTKFGNSLNFQGFPHMPGTDFVLSYPMRNTGVNDGGPVVS
ncbi:DUF2163 domain-containing protein [Roseibium sp.]|uniref:DUF2163 domain-containing protein n=1 Tax=Roseibium sp. TaxID=1936156 RepID=UPI003A96F5F2